MSIEEQLQFWQFAFAMAFVAVMLLACGWMLEAKVEDVLAKRHERRSPTEHCKLHQRPPEHCKHMHGDDE